MTWGVYRGRLDTVYGQGRRQRFIGVTLTGGCDGVSEKTCQNRRQGGSCPPMSITRATLAALATALLVTAGCSDDDPVTNDTPSATADPATMAPGPASTGAAPTTPSDPGTFPGSLANFVGTDVWIDPVGGDDANDGADRSRPLRTVAEAWNRIPQGTELTTGYRLRLLPGRYPEAELVPYWENRHGTDAAPIILEAVDGAHTAVLEDDLNLFDISYFALIGVDIDVHGDAVHCEQCDHLLIRDSEISGGGDAHETIKANQSQYLFIENADIHGAYENAIDYVAVQYGHITGSRIHDADDWCMYAKGGSAYLTISGNEVYDCGTGGITAGQGTGFEYMVAPWLQYEAYGIRVLDNVIHDTIGAGLGVNGGYNILFARNTLYSVGTNSHLVEFVHGGRSCDGDTDRCRANRDAGGWGPVAGDEVLIPNRHVFFVDNVIVNPAGVQSQWQHFAVHGPADNPTDSGAPSPAAADDDLRIIGNVIWNGGADMPLGVGDGQGCEAANPTCNAEQLLRDNRINSWQPELRDPANGDYRLTEASAADLPPATPLPDFDWSDAPVGVLAPTAWL